MMSFKATFANATSPFMVNTGVCIPPKAHLKSMLIVQTSGPV